MNTLTTLKKQLAQFGNPARARMSLRFFKTGKGQYAEGDRFMGATVPEVRTVVKAYRDLPLADVILLLKSPIHEERLLALLIMVAQFKKGDKAIQQKIHTSYLAHTRHINNWDLVDASAEYIVGTFLKASDLSLLTKLAVSKNLWERRIAMIATFHFIKNGNPKPTLRIAGILLHDEHDLIHKAVGWMLREVGKRCGEAAEDAFLKKHYRAMPRTMLRYAIERFHPEKRKYYLER